MADERDCHVKASKVGTKKFAFVRGDGTMNTLRVHASQFSRVGAKAFCKELAANNPGWEFKVQPIGGGR